MSGPLPLISRPRACPSGTTPGPVPPPISRPPSGPCPPCARWALRTRSNALDHGRWRRCTPPTTPTWASTSRRRPRPAAVRAPGGCTSTPSCGSASSLLDESPRPFPRGLHRLSDFPWAPVGEDAWRRWLDQTWADDPRAAAKAAFQYLWFYTRLTGCDHVDDLDDQARQVLAYMEARRDPATGFIGTGPDVELGWAMRGHRNLALNLLWPLGVDEPGIERMIDATLACQRPDGLFHDGGMCANMDAVHLLAEYARRTGHRRAESVQSARRCVRAMFRCLASPDGGFWFELAERDTTDPAAIHTTNGLAFALFTLHYWQALDRDARQDLARSLARVGIERD